MRTVKLAPLAVVVICLSLQMFAIPAQDPAESVSAILDAIERSHGKDVWRDAAALVGMGKGVLADVREGAQRADPFVNLAVAHYLYQFGDKNESLGIVKKMLKGNDKNARRAAVDEINAIAATDHNIPDEGKKAIGEELMQMASKSDDDLLSVSIWRAIWNLTEDISAKRELRKLVRSADKEVRYEATLGLAEMSAFPWIKDVLPEMAKEPGERGRLARAYLENMNLINEIDRKLQGLERGKPKYDYALLDELISTLQDSYYSADKIHLEELVEAAAKGIASSLDPYTTYHDEKSLSEIFKEMEGEYAGIGSRVIMRKDKSGREWLTIEEPIFSGPAYKAGLRSNDSIIEVEGEPSADKDITYLVNKLRGKPGTKVKFKIMRRGWQKAKEYELTREKIEMETTLNTLLPGNIGYLKMTSFGKRNSKEVEEAIDTMELNGMKALVFDLRGNPGGYLQTAVDIAELFIDQGKLIVSTEGRGVVLERKVSTRRARKPIPMVFLIDGGSASASEILAGAVQDYKLATIIGEKSFGKGSVQDIRKLKSTGEKTALRVTIAKWFLPTGRSIEKDDHEKSGVYPDITVERPERDFWKDAEFERIRSEGLLEDYFRKYFAEKKELFSKLAESDDLKFSPYPGFDELYSSLKTKASKEEVREIVREYARKMVANDRGKSYILDYETDIQLQRAIIELSKKIAVDYKKIPEYSYFTEKAQEPVKENGNGG